ncbi:glycosyltransferase [Agromyces sp. Marseille-P2726]|uniref:glycosyltransferase n=1 Tax=Agromyces sp. Marseille-P2726 TaxID=2709132 RepID=UPI00156D511F|nr:glycosyltransferase [Agromyces sp. Marseille-P2726]
MSPLGRLAAKRLGRPAPRGSIDATTFDDRPRRVLIAPVNYSGQGTAWARSLEAADPSISARNMAVDVPGGFSFDADLVVPVGTYHNDPDWQRRQFEAASRATHVLIEAEEPPFGRLLGRSVGAQARALIDRGVNVAFLGHGTDVRLPSRHMAGNEWSYYSDPSVYAPRAETVAARNIALVVESGRPAFVSTPDLLVDLPHAVWCPVAVDPRRWAAGRRPRDPATPLRVAHAPSVAAAKGTALIMPALERLEAEGVIELALIQGVPSRRMPAAFAEADVVLDQFRAGSYGVAACEAMAAGCIVVGHVSEQVRQAVRARTGRDLPILDATPTTLETVLRRLADDPGLDERRASMIEFVRSVHDGRLSAEILIDGWIQPAAPDDRKEASRASSC